MHLKRPNCSTRTVTRCVSGRLIAEQTVRLAVAFALLAVVVPASSASARSTNGVSVLGGGGASARVKRGVPFRSAPATDTMVVGIDPGSETRALAAIEHAGAKVLRRSKRAGFAVVRVPAGYSAGELESRLEVVPGVRFVEPEGDVRAVAIPDDPLFSQQWGMSTIGAPAAWDVTSGSAEVTIAVLDTGADLAHPDLAANIDTANDRDIINNDYTAQDDNGHGTHVAGIIAAVADNSLGVAGVAGRCTILPVKVLRADGGGTSSGVAEGVRWAADKGARVISMSLGTSTYSSALYEAVLYAASKNCFVVAASGNEARGTVLYPARLPEVIAVGSTAVSDTLSSFSNYGADLDITAPGTAIMSTTRGGGYGNMSGTSMATPHVAGVAGLLFAEHPTWGREAVEHVLLGTAKDLGAAGRDDRFGYGRLDAQAAVESTYQPPPPESDEDIPGLTLRSVPYVGQVNADTDIHDVFRVDLSQGDMLVLSLTAPQPTDFDLRVFGPDANSVTTDTPVAQSVMPAYPELVRYTATQDGSHYIDVEAFSGSGTYSLSWSVRRAGSPADDDIPGVALPADPVSGALDYGTDIDDVFSVSLSEGERLTVSLAAPAGSDFDLHLYGPEATSVLVADPLASAETTGYPDTLSFVAPADGVYFLDAFCFSGTGGYQLRYHVSPASLEADDDVPGIAFAANPATGTLDADTDAMDVHAFYVAEGQEVRVRLTGSAPAEFDLFAFGPDAVTADAASAIASSTAPGAAEELTFTTLVPGTYYAACRAASGSGSYTLEYSVRGDIPGFALPSSPASDTISVLDRHRVYRVSLQAGERLYLGLSAEADCDLDLYLYGPDATSLAQRTRIVAESFGEGSDERILYRAPRAGTYYVDVCAYEGMGRFNLVHGKPTVSTLTLLTGPSAVPYGQSALLSAGFLSADASPAEQPLVLQRFTGYAWVDSQRSAVDSAGAAYFTVMPTTRTYYRVVYPGDAVHVDSTSFPLEVAPGVAVATPAAPSFMLRSKAAVVTGTLLPGHGDAGQVRVYRYRYYAGKWVRYGYANATVVSAEDSSVYSAKVSLPYTGRWRLRAYAPADDEHASSWSVGYDTVTVGTRGDLAVIKAKRLIGAKYAWGATGPAAFDSSGFVRYAYSQAGIRLPRTVAMQSRTGYAVKRANLRPGDLVFFYSPARHVGIYIGGGKMIDCSRSNGAVGIHRLYSSYSAARRVW